jgi:hypothetical protein
MTIALVPIAYVHCSFGEDIQPLTTKIKRISREDFDIQHGEIVREPHAGRVKIGEQWFTGVHLLQPVYNACNAKVLSGLIQNVVFWTGPRENGELTCYLNGQTIIHKAPNAEREPTGE